MVDPHPDEFLWEEIPEEYRSALPGSLEFHRQYDLRILAARDGTTECSGHVGSEADRKICSKCGIHIDDLRPDDDHAPDRTL